MQVKRNVIFKIIDSKIGSFEDYSTNENLSKLARLNNESLEILTPFEIEQDETDKFVRNLIKKVRLRNQFNELNYLPLWCLGIARSFIHRGGDPSHPNRAIEYLSNALKYGFSDVITEGRIHHQLGLAYSILSHRNLALKHYTYALQKYRRLEELLKSSNYKLEAVYKQADLCCDLSGLYCQSGKFDFAQYYAKIAYKVSDIHNYKERKFMSKFCQSSILANRGIPGKAIDLLENSLLEINFDSAPLVWKQKWKMLYSICHLGVRRNNGDEFKYICSNLLEISQDYGLLGQTRRLKSMLELSKPNYIEAIRILSYGF